MSQEEIGAEILATFTKNGRGEEVRIRRFEFRGLDTIEVRRWYLLVGGEMVGDGQGESGSGLV